MAWSVAGLGDPPPPSTAWPLALGSGAQVCTVAPGDLRPSALAPSLSAHQRLALRFLQKFSYTQTLLAGRLRREEDRDRGAWTSRSQAWGA